MFLKFEYFDADMRNGAPGGQRVSFELKLFSCSQLNSNRKKSYSSKAEQTDGHQEISIG